jgi:hypothetical protein
MDGPNLQQKSSRSNPGKVIESQIQPRTRGPITGPLRAWGDESDKYAGRATLTTIQYIRGILRSSANANQVRQWLRSAHISDRMYNSDSVKPYPYIVSIRQHHIRQARSGTFFYKTFRHFWLNSSNQSATGCEVISSVDQLELLTNTV